LSRILLILKNKTAAVLFVTAAAAGAVLIFWYLNNIRHDESMDQNYEIVEENGKKEVDCKGHDIHQERFSTGIPPGMKAVNIPVSFFGDCSMITKSDRVDIISIYYNKESDKLDSEIILRGKEIIDFDTGQSQSENITESVGGLILSEDYSRSGINSNIKNILIITFYLDSEEVGRALEALESGMLYLALCSGQGISDIY
jgi:hypothetical protein